MGQRQMDTDPFCIIGVHGTLMMFLFGRGRDPPPEILSSLNISASDFQRIPTINATLSNYNSTALATDA